MSTPSIYQVRDPAEIQRAHDVLVAIILGEIQLPIEEISMLPLRAAADVLCWVLKHDHNQQFADNLAQIEAEAEKAGYLLVNHGRPIPPEERYA